MPDSKFSVAITTFQNNLKGNCEKNINCLISSQDILTESNPYKPSSNLLLQTIEGNSSSFENIVDYENPLYLNAKIPLFGTATTTAELAPDGTLTKAINTVDSTKLADSIPLKEFLLDKLDLLADPTVAAAEFLNQSAESSTFTLSISIDGYRYIFSKIHPYEVGLNLPALTFGQDGISVAKTRFAEAPKSAEEKPKNSISFDGSIILPDEKPGS